MKATAAEINKIFTNFTKLKALVIGDLMVDSYVFGKVDRISPEAPVPIIHVKSTESRLGGAANVALNLAALGVKPILAGVIGADTEGRQFARLLKKHNLEEKGVVTSVNRVTTVKTRIVGNNMQMLRIDEENTETLDKADKEKFLSLLSRLILNDSPHVVIFEDYDKGVIDEDVIAHVVKTCKGRKIPVCVDPKKRNFLAYEKVTLFKPNLKELREGLKLDSNLGEEEELLHAVKKLEKKLENHLSLVTLSERGILVSHKGKKTIIPAHKRTIVDVSGAGDTVIAVSSACVAQDVEPTLMAALANMAGGLVCEKPGVVPIDAEEFKAEALKLLK
jgi:rfaE bifunctional protein kinase chain/domain